MPKELLYILIIVLVSPLAFLLMPFIGAIVAVGGLVILLAFLFRRSKTNG